MKLLQMNIEELSCSDLKERSMAGTFILDALHAMTYKNAEEIYSGVKAYEHTENNIPNRDMNTVN
jgi:hypothetical protein